MSRSLIVKLGAIGDVASAIPAAWELHRSGSAIDWLCGKSVEPLLSCYSWIRPIVASDAILAGPGPGPGTAAAIAELLRIWIKLAGSSLAGLSLAGSRYDLCAILQYDRRYRMLTLPVRARRTISLERDHREFKLVSERHHTAEFARILCNLPDRFRAENFAPVSPDRLPPCPMPRNGKTRVALAPGGARNPLRDDPQRRWPLESYTALARILLDRGYEVVTTGGPGDAWVEAGFAGLPVVNRIGAWAIPQTIAFYGSCDCVVTHDSGPMHLAGVTECGLVGLFGPTTPSKALPRRKDVIGLWGGERLACRPCYDGHTFAPCNWNACMMAVTPQHAADAVDAILHRPGAEWRVESL